MRVTWEIPSRYEQRPFRRVFQRLSRPVPSGAGIVTAYTDGQVTLRTNRAKERYHEAADLSTFQGVRPGDFVVHGLDIMRGSIGVADSSGAMSPVCIVASAREGNVPRYMAYQMRLQASTGYPKALARGVRDGGADFRRWDTLAELPLLCPSLIEQRAIADYLDRETAKIDTLIEKQRTMIQRLRERRVAVQERRVQDSSWPTPALASTCRLIQTGPFGSQLGAGDYVDDGVPVLNPQHLAGNVITADRAVTVTPAIASKLRRHRLMRGDIIAARRGELGRCAEVTEREVGMLCGTGSVLVRPALERWEPAFLQLAFSSRRTSETLAQASVGSTMPNLNTSMIGRLRLGCPPLDEQRSIVEQVGRETAKIDTLIAKVERHIELAGERRAALITAAVSGQIDVTKDAA